MLETCITNDLYVSDIIKGNMVSYRVIKALFALNSGGKLGVLWVWWIF